MRLQVIGQTKHPMGSRTPVWREVGSHNQQPIAVGRGGFNGDSGSGL